MATISTITTKLAEVTSLITMINSLDQVKVEDLKTIGVKLDTLSLMTLYRLSNYKGYKDLSRVDRESEINNIKILFRRLDVYLMGCINSGIDSSKKVEKVDYNRLMDRLLEINGKFHLEIAGNSAPPKVTEEVIPEGSTLKILNKGKSKRVDDSDDEQAEEINDDAFTEIRTKAQKKLDKRLKNVHKANKAREATIEFFNAPTVEFDFDLLKDMGSKDIASEFVFNFPSTGKLGVELAWYPAKTSPTLNGKRVVFADLSSHDKSLVQWVETQEEGYIPLDKIGAINLLALANRFIIPKSLAKSIISKPETKEDGNLVTLLSEQAEESYSKSSLIMAKSLFYYATIEHSFESGKLRLKPFIITWIERLLTIADKCDVSIPLQVLASAIKKSFKTREKDEISTIINKVMNGFNMAMYACWKPGELKTELIERCKKSSQYYWKDEWHSYTQLWEEANEKFLVRPKLNSFTGKIKSFLKHTENKAMITKQISKIRDTGISYKTIAENAVNRHAVKAELLNENKYFFSFKQFLQSFARKMPWNQPQAAHLSIIDHFKNAATKSGKFVKDLLVVGSVGIFYSTKPYVDKDNNVKLKPRWWLNKLITSKRFVQSKCFDGLRYVSQIWYAEVEKPVTVDDFNEVIFTDDPKSTDLATALISNKAVYAKFEDDDQPQLMWFYDDKGELVSHIVNANFFKFNKVTIEENFVNIIPKWENEELLFFT
jgi:hypothetical protein